MSSSVCRLYSSTYPSMPGTEIRVLWKSSLIYLCFNVTAVSSIESFWYCWPLVSLVTNQDLSCLHPLPPCLLFRHIPFLGECHSLPKGLPANSCKLQMFSQAAHSERKHFPSSVSICQTEPMPWRRHKLRVGEGAPFVSFSVCLPCLFMKIYALCGVSQFFKICKL